MTASRALGATSFLFGAGWASWIVRIPDIRDHLALSPRALGIALLGVALGAFAAMAGGAWLIERAGAGRVTRVALLVFCATLPLPALATGAAMLFTTALLLGIGRGVLGVATNAYGSAIERADGRPVLASVHAFYSLGAVGGATVGGLVTSLSTRLHLSAAGILFGAIAVFVSLPDLPVARTDRARGSTRGLLPVGAIAFAVLFGQAAVADWSGLFLKDVVHVTSGMVALGYASYAVSMTTFRLVGDRLGTRIGEARLVRFGAASAAFTLGVAILFPHPCSAVAGFVAVGAGSAAVFPIAVRSAGGRAGSSTAIAFTQAAGFLGSLTAPLVIGLTAARTSLRFGFGWVVVSCLVVAVLAPAVTSKVG